jgi:hypothetical protein
MKEQDSFDNFLAAHLRESQAYLPDEGFSAGVMNALPTASPRRPMLAYVIFALPVLVISLLVFSQFPFAAVFGGVWYWLIQVDSWGWLQMGLGVSACLTLAGIGWFLRMANDW